MTMGATHDPRARKKEHERGRRKRAWGTVGDRERIAERCGYGRELNIEQSST